MTETKQEKYWLGMNDKELAVELEYVRSCWYEADKYLEYLNEGCAELPDGALPLLDRARTKAADAEALVCSMEREAANRFMAEHDPSFELNEDPDDWAGFLGIMSIAVVAQVLLNRWRNKRVHRNCNK